MQSGSLSPLWVWRGGAGLAASSSRSPVLAPRGREIEDGRRQPAIVFADASAPACPPTARADPGAPPPEPLPCLLLGVIHFSGSPSPSLSVDTIQRLDWPFPHRRHLEQQA